MTLRILVANEGVDDPGGVHTYLSAVIPELRARGHAVAFLHFNPRTSAFPVPAERSFGVRDLGLDAAIARIEAWRPDLCFSHNMHPLEVDLALAERWPVVKMMHGYFGTCISGQKAWLWPSRAPCARAFGAACLGYFLPRRCGEASVPTMLRQYTWARRQRTMFDTYTAIVVASDHMFTEYERNGAAGGKLRRVPLFAPPLAAGSPRNAPVSGSDSGGRVLFLGRMTDLKGGDLLVRAVALLAKQGRQVSLTMAGDGPARAAWQALARRSGVDAQFPGWVNPAARANLLARATVLAVPSVWPEPFGLVGLEAAAAGVPAVAFQSGGVSQWLRDGDNGLFAGDRPDAGGLAHALGMLLFDPSLRERLACGARASARHLTIERHIDSLMETALVPAAAAASLTCVSPTAARPGVPQM